MINIRSDRNSIPRTWAAPEPPTAENRTYLKAMQDAEMAAFRSLMARIGTIAFEGRDHLAPVLAQSLDSLTRLQTEYWDGVTKPLASRRADLGPAA